MTAPDVPHSSQCLTSPASKQELNQALRFVHLVEAQTQARVADMSATLHALVETLIGEGAVPVKPYQKRRHLMSRL